MNRYSIVQRWMPTSPNESMMEWIRMAARTTSPEDSGEILNQLIHRYGRSPRAIQASIDLLHRIPPRYSESHIQSEHLHKVFHNWQQAFLRGKPNVLPEDVVRWKLTRWAKTYGPDFEVDSLLDRKLKRKDHFELVLAGQIKLTDDSSDYDYFKVIRVWADSARPDACAEIGKLVEKMKDQGVALSILLGVIQDRGSMEQIPHPDAIQLLLDSGYGKLMVRTAIRAGRNIVGRCGEPESFRVAKDVLDTFKRYKASTPEAVHLSFDILENLVQESADGNWFGCTQHYHNNLFNNYKRAARRHYVIGAQILARRVKQWAQTGMFTYSKTTIKLLLDVVVAQHKPRDAVVYMDEVITLLSDESQRMLTLHSPLYRTMIKAWASSKRSEAKDKIRLIIESANAKIDVGGYNAALRFWRGDVDLVEWTIVKMHQHAVEMNAFSWLQVVACYASNGMIEKAERAMFRLNDNVGNFHGEQVLASGFLVLLKAYLIQAKTSENTEEIIEKCNHLYEEIVLKGKIRSLKIRDEIQATMTQIHQIGGSVSIPRNPEPVVDEMFPLYADEEELADKYADEEFADFDADEEKFVAYDSDEEEFAGYLDTEFPDDVDVNSFDKLPFLTKTLSNERLLTKMNSTTRSTVKDD